MRHKMLKPRLGNETSVRNYPARMWPSPAAGTASDRVAKLGIKSSVRYPELVNYTWKLNIHVTI